MADVPSIPVPDGYEVRSVAWRDATEDELRLGYACESEQAALLKPGEPFEPFEAYVAGTRSLPGFIQISTWLVTESATGEPAAIGFCHFPRRPENPHMLWFEIIVRAPHRRRGIASHLLSKIAEVSLAESRPSLTAKTWDCDPDGEAFLRSLDATAGLVQRESELDLSTLDREIVQRWLDEGPERAPDYELVLIEGPYPHDDPEQMAAIAKVHDAMNGAPRDDLPMEDRERTPEELIQWDLANEGRNQLRWEYFARHKGSREYAGFSNVHHSPWNPAVVDQGGTAVAMEHRGFALGKWMKAAMLDKILRERPEARIVRTQNAYSNDAMLGINVALGFEIARSETDWVLPIEKVLDHLATPGLSAAT